MVNENIADKKTGIASCDTITKYYKKSAEFYSAINSALFFDILIQSSVLLERSGLLCLIM